MLHIIVVFINYIENVKILNLLLEKNPDLTIKNRKGQTAIDITNSKTIINIFWKHLTSENKINSIEKGSKKELDKVEKINKIEKKRCPCTFRTRQQSPRINKDLFVISIINNRVLIKFQQLKN